MTRKTWRDVDISAYIDGELDQVTTAAFEAALARDAALRHKVEAMRVTVDFVRAVPATEPPRNYLVTPSMVAERPQAPPRRKQLRALRWATSLTAVAFVISMGLNLLQMANPTTITESQQVYDAAAPKMAMTMEVEAPAEATIEMVQQENEKADAEQGTRGTLTVEEEAALEPLSPEPGLPAGEGLGGGAEAPRPLAMKQGENETVEATMTYEAPLHDEDHVTPTDRMAGEVVSPTVGVAPLDTAGGAPSDDAEGVPNAAVPPPEPLSVVETTPSFPPRWLTRILGGVTLILAVITFWKSRRV